MSRLRTAFGFFSFALACSLLVPTAKADDKKDETKAATCTGTWTWTMKRGDQEIKQTLKLKQDGAKVTGTIEGPQGGEVEVSEGKLDGADISFHVVREFNGNSFTIKYKGKLEGDTIKGKTSMERDGNVRERDWEAKREGKKA